MKAKNVSISSWPKTSYNEFSKRMFICFMFGFFIHIVLTIFGEAYMGLNGNGISILSLCIPVYTTIFAATIVKSGVENVFKGKTLAAASTSDEDEENG